MASVVDICNLALSHVGDRANITSIDPPDGSAQAQHCARYYASCRDTVLLAHPWQFATKRALLVATTLDVDSWNFKYALPTLYLKIHKVLPYQATSDHPGVKFAMENNFIYCDEENATAYFTYKQEDPGTFPQYFIDPLARLMASRMAGPIIKGREGRAEAKAQLQLYAFDLATGKSLDSNLSNDDIEYTPAGIAARGPEDVEHLITVGEARWG